MTDMTTTFKGTPIMIAGKFPQVGDTAPEFHLAKNDLSDFSLKEGKGEYLILTKLLKVQEFPTTRQS